jgi:hypothetical protein
VNSYFVCIFVGQMAEEIMEGYSLLASHDALTSQHCPGPLVLVTSLSCTNGSPRALTELWMAYSEALVFPSFVLLFTELRTPEPQSFILE